MIDAFSEAAGCIFQHFDRFETPDVIHTDQGPAFRNELFSELSRLSQVEHSFATAYSKEENGLVERANQELMRHLRAMLFDARVHDKWSYEQLLMVQRIMNTVEKTSTGVTPGELILNNSIRLSNRILAPGSANPTSRVALSDTMDNWVARQNTLLQVAQVHQHQSDSHLLVEYDPRITEYPIHTTCWSR
jgi:transposase InsO family protein